MGSIFYLLLQYNIFLSGMMLITYIHVYAPHWQFHFVFMLYFLNCFIWYNSKVENVFRCIGKYKILYIPSLTGFSELQVLKLLYLVFFFYQLSVFALYRWHVDLYYFLLIHDVLSKVQYYFFGFVFVSLRVPNSHIGAQ